MSELERDVSDIARIKAIPTILDIICRMTGMRFAAVARVTEDRWIACEVRDEIDFGLKPGGELEVETTLCNEIRQSGTAIVIDHVAQDEVYCRHHTPELYGLQSYISMPIVLSDGTFFGTLCAIDPEPRTLNTPETLAMFEMFSDIIGFQLSALHRVDQAEANLLDERAVSALREQFIAVLGHDLRNPLASIGGGVRIIRREEHTKKSAEVLTMIEGSVRRMAGLIDNVLDFARGRLGSGITLDRKVELLEPVLQQVVDELMVVMPERRIVADFSLPQPIECDRARMGQLVSNLLGNALVHGDPATPVRIVAKADGATLKIDVANEGAPIPPEAMARLFQPFFRGEIRPNQQGLGLGLHIASEIARAHGGEIAVSSSPEQTRFTFEMPLGRA